MGRELTHASELIESYGCDQSNLITIMQEIQAEYKYLSIPMAFALHRRNKTC